MKCGFCFRENETFNIRHSTFNIEGGDFEHFFHSAFSVRCSMFDVPLLVAMSTLNSILILLIAFLAVFCESAFNGFRYLLGAQIDLLPAIIVYAALSAGLPTITLISVLGGLFFDSLSANPLGISIIPLFIVGFAISTQRELILRDQLFAQSVLGLSASAFVPAAILLLLLTGGHAPALSWVSVWQWVVMSVGGMIATPALFLLFGWFDGLFSYRSATQMSFRPDREIRRSRR
jgi:rod shape-determining protein MreD